MQILPEILTFVKSSGENNERENNIKFLMVIINGHYE